MLKLYYIPDTCALVPHVALQWTKAPYRTERLDFTGLRTPEFLALNPQARVPVLTDGDWTLTQNTAILDYLNDCYPQAALFGSGNLRQKARARQWLALANTELHSRFSLLFSPEKFTGDAAGQTKIRTAAAEDVRTIYRQAEEVLQTQNYLCGKEITVADVYFYVTLRWARFLKLDLNGFTALPAFFARVESDTAVQAVLKEQGLAS